MIWLGYTDDEKREVIAREAAARGVDTIHILAPERFTARLDDLEASGLRVDYVEWLDTYRYKTMYRLLQEIGPRSMLVINECLRSQDRSLLRFNCIRHYTLQTDHTLVFQRAPLIDKIDDFATLFDFVTKSRWKRTPFAELPLDEVQVFGKRLEFGIEAVTVEAPESLRSKYAKEKRRRIDTIGLGDPHTIPRNLHLLAGKVRAEAMVPGRTYVARNGRIKSEQLVTYQTIADGTKAGVLDFPHRFIDWSDFLAATGQTRVEAIVSDLPVDQWYLERFRGWCQRVNDAQATLLDQDVRRRSA